jgi:hypothetical protein
MGGGTGQLPAITSFTASPTSTTAQMGSTLSWVTTGATSLSIAQGVGSVSGSEGSLDVFPGVTTTYTLSAENDAGTVTAEATVTVVPQVIVFEQQPPNQTFASGLSTYVLATVVGGTMPYTAQLIREGTVDPVRTWTGDFGGSLFYTTPVLRHATDDGARYHFEIQDSAVPPNRSKSNVATITVLPTPIPTLVGSLNSARSQHTATLLGTGKVLVAGGKLIGSVSAELYDPSTRQFTATTHPMVTTRFLHKAVLLASGKVLLVGGHGWPSSTALRSTELYDPGTDTFTAGPDLSTPRVEGHSVTTLTAGPRAGQLLIAGGEGTGTSSTFDLYDPASNTIVESGALTSTTQRRAFHVAAELDAGQVLLAGGSDGLTSLDTVEVYDCQSTATSLASPLPGLVSAPVGTMLPTGRVFLLGTGPSATPTNGFPYVLDPGVDPLTAAWSVVTPDYTGCFPTYSYYSYFDRSRGHTVDHFTVGPLAGWVLVIGGNRGSATDGSYAFDTVRNLGYPLPAMANRREYHTSTWFPDGTILVVGGQYGSSLATAELFE